MKSQKKVRSMASLDFQTVEAGKVRLTLRGRLDAETTGRLWLQVLKKVAQTKPEKLAVDASEVDYCDGAGVAFLLELKRRQQADNGEIEIEGLKGEFAQLMTMFDPGPPLKPEPQPPALVKVTEDIGKAVVNYGQDSRSLVSFIGELCSKLMSTLLHPRTLRWKDTFLLAEKSGADAVGIIALLGFLIGLILAFQSAVGMRKFGAEIYVADLVVVSLFRELGPLITAIILASRSGSAFAAELGTMKVNEEIDALSTMGLDPVRFLVVPRVIAAVFVMPLLTMFNLLLGLIGCGLVMVSIGFPPITYFNQIQEAAGLMDLFGGLVKTFVFGAMIGGIGCLRGLQTGTGASAVGDSATRAVVSSIIAVVVADGVFAVIYYFLGI
ncbi:MAG: MlaE family lipid ABC transporter permease subunit [Planctomycetota bacterium]|jgi:phospholipid/cholesterol/gamma-HCH transport system permease protein